MPVWNIDPGLLGSRTTWVQIISCYVCCLESTVISCWHLPFVAVKENNNKVFLRSVSIVGSFTTPFIFASGWILPFLRLYSISLFLFIYLILFCIFINYYLLWFLLLTSLRHWRSMCIGTPVPRTHCPAASPPLVYLPKSNLFLPFLVPPCLRTCRPRICRLTL